MKDPKDACKTSVNDSIIKLQENNAVAKFNNQSRVTATKVQVDGCEMNGSGEIRCDYLLYADKRINFIELKGTDVKHAIEQLKASLRYFDISKNESREVYAYVVCRNVRPLLNTHIQNSIALMYRNQRVNLIVRNSPLLAPLQ